MNISDYKMVYGVLLLIASIILGAAYMIGKALEREEWITWTKIQLAELIVVLIFPLFLYMFTYYLETPVANSIDPIGTNYFCTGIQLNHNCLMSIGGSYLENLIRESLAFYKTLVYSNYFPSMFGSTQLMFNHLGTKSEVSYGFKFLELFVGTMDYFTSMLGKVIIVISFIYLFLLFFYKISGALLLLGLLLRMLPLTRRIGGLILAIYVGFMFFYPFMLSFSDSIYWSFPADEHTHGHIFKDVLFILGSDQVNMEGLIKEIKDPFNLNEISTYQDEANKESSNFVSDLFGWLKDLTIDFWKQIKDFKSLVRFVESIPVMFYYLTIVSTTGYNYSFFDPILSQLADFIIWGPVIQLFYLIATIGVIKNLSSLLGGDSEIAGLTHFI